MKQREVKMMQCYLNENHSNEIEDPEQLIKMAPNPPYGKVCPMQIQRQHGCSESITTTVRTRRQRTMFSALLLILMLKIAVNFGSIEYTRFSQTKNGFTSKPDSGFEVTRKTSAIKNYVTPISRSTNKRVRTETIPRITLEDENALADGKTLTDEKNEFQEGIPTNEGNETAIQKQEEIKYKKVPGSPYVAIDPKRVATAVGRAPVLNGYKDTWSPRNRKDIAVFWQIPAAGGSVIENIISSCHKLTMTSDAGIAEGHDQDTKLDVVSVAGPTDADMGPNTFVNVDTTTILGIERAQQMGLVRSELARVMVTPFIFEPESLFDATRRGRLFTMFRHPVDRAVRMFVFSQSADWKPTYSPILASMSIEQYAESSYAEDNWMTRYLSNDPNPEAALTNAHVEVAMDVVRRKFLVGLSDKREESLERFEKFFWWKFSVDPSNQDKCRELLLEKGANSNHKVEMPQPGSQSYELLVEKNLYDIKLYNYVELLFKEQEQFVANIPDGFRLEGTNE